MGKCLHRGRYKKTGSMADTLLLRAYQASLHKGEKERTGRIFFQEMINSMRNLEAIDEQKNLSPSLLSSVLQSATVLYQKYETRSNLALYEELYKLVALHVDFSPKIKTATMDCLHAWKQRQADDPPTDFLGAGLLFDAITDPDGSLRQKMEKHHPKAANDASLRIKGNKAYYDTARDILYMPENTPYLPASLPTFGKLKMEQYHYRQFLVSRSVPPTKKEPAPFDKNDRILLEASFLVRTSQAPHDYNAYRNFLAQATKKAFLKASL